MMRKGSSVSGQVRFIVVHDYPPADIEQRWRRCVQDVDFATHYTTPEYFREPFLQSKKPFAVLSIDAEDEVAAICTGIHVGRSAKCGLWGRPQVAISRSAHSETAVAGLVAGLRVESRSCHLIDV